MFFNYLSDELKNKIIDDVGVENLIEKKCVYLSPRSTVQKAVELFCEEGIDEVPVVVEDSEVVGILKKDDLFYFLAQELKLNEPVEKVVKKLDNFVKENSTVLEAWNEFNKTGMETLPVINNDNVIVGIIKSTQLLELLEKSLINVFNNISNYFYTVHNGIVRVDKNGVITFINNAAAIILDVDPGEVQGELVENIFSHFNIKKVIDSGRNLISQKEEVNDMEVLVNYIPLFEEGKVVGVIIELQNISELEKTTNDLDVEKDLPEELDAIIESSYDGIVVADLQGKLLKINKAYERITGLKPSNLVNRNVADVVNDNIVSKSATLEVIEKKRPVTIKQNIITGKEMLVTGSPIFDKKTKELKYIISNCRDLTELYELQKELEKTHQLTNKYYNEVQKLRAQQTKHDEIIAKSYKMEEAVEMAKKFAEVDCNVLLLGETGVGKDVIAKFIHNNGERAEGPFIKVNCGAIPENLLETEFFGYDEGAFTGSKKGGKQGSLELADKGTLFLDEIGELPINLQVKLLNILQDQEFKRVGGTKNIKTDVRIISATNKNLYNKVLEGNFRSDLYYRMNVVNIKIPPLRERKEDILPLMLYFINKYNNKYERNIDVSRLDIDAFYKYDWPGNIRELENLIESIIVTNRTNDVIESIKPKDREKNYNKTTEVAEEADVESPKQEKKKIMDLYEEYQSTRKVAKILGVDQSTIVRKMKKYNISPLYS